MRELISGWVGINAEESGEAAGGAGCPSFNVWPCGRRKKRKSVKMHFTNVSGATWPNIPVGEKDLKSESVCDPVKGFGENTEVMS